MLYCSICILLQDFLDRIIQYLMQNADVSSQDNTIESYHQTKQHNKKTGASLPESTDLIFGKGQIYNHCWKWRIRKPQTKKQIIKFTIKSSNEHVK